MSLVTITCPDTISLTPKLRFTRAVEREPGVLHAVYASDLLPDTKFVVSEHQQRVRLLIGYSTQFSLTVESTVQHGGSIYM